MKYDIYFAAPFFCVQEKNFNNEFVSILEKSGLTVFYPARDGIIAKGELNSGKDWECISEKVWECDTSAINNSKVVLAILDGRTIDEGVCIEIGFAAAKNKPIIAFNSDDRKVFAWGHNPMVLKPIRKFTSTFEECISTVSDLLI